ncbi:cell division protein FtsZ [Magnetovibrio sp.]|uniref:cell division protein FtsZ n=1 Tax=Magnetovibrio sp. TaxID=2024836 RepID=UPI002F921BBB
MSINLSVPQNEAIELKPRITVIGVGGAGGNAVNNMINAQLEGVEFIVANTDAQALASAATDRRIQLGTGLTQGLGAGSKPEIGRAAAEESIADLNEHLKGSHMVFIAAGMGGGTGTGAAPVIARAARDLGVLTVGVVTKPFQFEGRHRYRIAEKGIEELEQYVDTLIIIPNQNLFRVANEKTTFSDAFKMADDVLYSGVRGVTDLMVMPGLINLDFADVRSVMSEMGKAMMGTGEAEGERRALDAAEAAISNPLLDDTSMAGANGVLINITGGSDMTLFEVDEAANRIRSEVEEDAYIIFGSTFDDSLEGRIRVSVVATGIDAESMTRPQPAVLNVHDDMVSRTVMPHVEADEPAVQAEVAQTQTQPSVAEILTQTMADPSDEAPAHDPVDDPVMTAEVEAPQDLALDLDEPARERLDFSHTEQSASADLDVEEDEDMGAPEPARIPSSFAMPAGMPSVGADDAFIPPAPAMSAHADEVDIDPMAEAAMVNGAAIEAPQKPAVTKGPSLFERVTGGAKSKVSMFGQSKTEKAEAPRPAATSAAPSTQLRTSAMAEPTLGGLDPEERLQPSHAEDDLLDIPAFLRRQAN